MPSPPPTVFISYSHNENDVVYKDRLLVHLKGLVQRNVIANWHDKLLTAGQLWDDEIIRNLETSRVILLLISPDFIASDYIGEVELARASQRYARGEILVIPVLISEVHGWKEKAFGKHKLGDFQVPTGNLQFIDSLPKQQQNAAFAKVVEGIERAIQNLKPASGAEVVSSSIPRRPIFGFVARHDAQGGDIVARLMEELAPGKNALVTLSGPGGVGKTTLAAEAARALLDVYGGRIAWSSAAGRAAFELYTLLDDIAAQLGRTDLRTL
ncbi:MAG: toll/interleukin-1 receptor domain-containing protein, partial [Acidobacteria bacterium]|nr:toll/interleukin-1 receptor domain-containing protein [Acidobacteriota bacterium]